MKKLAFFIVLLMPFFALNASELSDRLKGRILLQVESRGEAWYIQPQTGSRFYLGRPTDAFRVMREQGLGISNKDFALFEKNAPDRLLGMILIKVEDLGKAYYVNPIDKKMHFLGRPTDAFRVMRELGLGISNNNLGKIEVDGKSSQVMNQEMNQEKNQENNQVSENNNGESSVDNNDESAEGEENGDSVSVDEDVSTSTNESTDDAEETATSTDETSSGDLASSSDCVFFGEYFGNKNLFGSPVATTTVSDINFDWETTVIEGVANRDKFSARWTANCSFEEGSYEFRTVFDDAIKVFFDGENFLQSWEDNDRVRSINRKRSVEAGLHEIKIEYYNYKANAQISVNWEKVN